MGDIAQYRFREMFILNGIGLYVSVAQALKLKYAVTSSWAKGGDLDLDLDLDLPLDRTDL